MGLPQEFDENQSSDFNYDEDVEDYDIDEKIHKNHVRRMLEERLERKRLKQELDDELEGEFDWKDYDR